MKLINSIKKTKITLWSSLLFFGLFFVFTSTAHAEVIRDFSSTINVLPDSSIFVQEKITYDFEFSIRHGIERDISLLNSKKEPIIIDDISVIDGNKNASKFTTNRNKNLLTIKIGDPDKMVAGIQEYNISYRVWGSISYFDDFDEIYWNTTGNNWQVPILKSEAKVILPNNIFSTKEACYYGKSGSVTPCLITDSKIFTPGVKLAENEGLTVAVGFPKGIVSLYKTQIEDKKSNIIKTFWPILIPIYLFFFMFIRWYKKGRDSKGSGVIVPQYDVFENLTPLEVAGIMNGRIINEDISAEIIYLATKGFIKIKQIDETCDNFLCLVSKKDYHFTLLKEMGLLTNTFDKIIMKAIFDDKGTVGGTSKLSDLNNKFYKSIQKINDAIADTLLEKGYYTNFPKTESFKRNKYVGLTIYIIGALFVFYFKFSDLSSDYIGLLVLLLSIISAFLIYKFFNRIMSAKSQKGARAYEYFLGLKEYLQIAEKDRLNFHNDPDKKPETFEILLPYAMIFNVEESWAKEFKDIYIKAPEWYENKSSSFNIESFGHEMVVFNTLATVSFSSYPNNSGNAGRFSGSSGGGFSGGGGGGGGGRSW